MYVLDTETKKIVEKEVTFTPGFYKIFDEIVVNAPITSSVIPT